MNKRGVLVLAPVMILLGVAGCGGGDSEQPPEDNLPMSLTKTIELDAGHSECAYGGIQTDTGLDDNDDGQLQSDEVESTTYQCDEASDLASADKKWLALDILKQGINTSEPKSYYLHLPEDRESLVIYLAAGSAGEALGDPDIYVKRDGTAVAGEGVDSGANDCISYNGGGYNEVCIIDKPLAGDYHILIDASAQVSDADLFATTALFNTSQVCDETLKIRSQHLSQAEVQKACETLSETREKFNALIDSSISPYFGTPVVGDLNQVTNFHIFASLSNHMTWVEHLWGSNNSSGIYFETAPTQWWHSSDILSFDAIEWSGGYSVVRSLAHEYVHALDARFNKADAYRWESGWWSEGLAEYLGTHHNLPYQRVVHGHQGAPYTLSQIVNRENFVDVYSWGELAIAFLFEKHPQKVTDMLELMYTGEWDEFQNLMNDFADNYQAEFETFYQTEVPQQFRESAKPVALDSYQLIEGRGGWLFSVELTEVTDSITFKTSGGSGDVDLWVNFGSAVHPNLDQSFNCSSITESTNEEVCTIDDPQSGTYFVTVGSSFSGADIVDLYLSVCSGESCEVLLPEAKPKVAAQQPYLPHWPEKGTFGECTLEESYGRDTLTYASTFTVVNESDKAVNLHWINNYDGAAGSAFDALEPGESYENDWWRVGDRLMLKDAANECIAVAIVNDSDNRFVIDDALVADAATEAPEPVDGTLGECGALLQPYTRTSDAAQVLVTNNASQTINLHWVDTATGQASTSNDYGPLATGQSYSADYWVVGDRMAVYSDGSCIGVIDLTDSNMVFEITDSDF